MLKLMPHQQCKSKNIASVQAMPEQFENRMRFDSKKNSLQDFDAKEMYLYPKNRPVSFQKRRQMFCFHHFRVFTRCCFQNLSVKVPFSKHTIFEICRPKNVPFSCEREAYPSHYHRFQKVPGSCECSHVHSVNVIECRRRECPSSLCTDPSSKGGKCTG